MESFYMLLTTLHASNALDWDVVHLHTSLLCSNYGQRIDTSKLKKISSFLKSVNCNTIHLVCFYYQSVYSITNFIRGCG